MPAQLSGILLAAVFALTAVAGIILAWRLVVLSSPPVRQGPGRKAGRAPVVPPPSPAEPDGAL
jgi:hypothetical protein